MERWGLCGAGGGATLLLRGGGLGLLNLVETGLGQGELLLEVLNDYTAVRKVCGCQVRAVEVSGECPITQKNHWSWAARYPCWRGISVDLRWRSSPFCVSSLVMRSATSDLEEG